MYTNQVPDCLGYNIRVPNIAIAPGASTVHVSDGSGDAWVSLSMFHHLHCLVSTMAKCNNVGAV